MHYEIQTRSRTMREYVEALMPSLIRQLGLEHSRKYLLIDIAKNASPSALGVMQALPDFGSCIIGIQPQPWERLGLTLAHEMVHVKQFAKGHFCVEDGQTWWRGRWYGEDTPYYDRPWEIEAYSKQELLFRRAATEE